MVVVRFVGGLGEDEGEALTVVLKFSETTFVSSDPNCQPQFAALPPILLAKVAAS
jgi:hypothetical protein